MAFVGSDSEATEGETGVAALDTSDGTVIWRDDDPGRVLCIQGETVFVGDDTLRAHDASSGELRWRYDDGSSAVYTCQPGESALYVGRHGYLDVLDPGGSRRGRLLFPGKGWVGTALADGRLYVAGPGLVEAHGSRTRLESLTGDMPQQVWASETGFPLAPVVTDGVVLAGDLHPTEAVPVTAFDAENGRRRWQTDPLGTYVRRPAVVGENGFVRVADELVRFNCSTGEVLSRRPLGEGSAAPVAGDGLVVAGTADDGATIGAIDVETDERVWTAGSGDTGPSQLALAGGAVYVGTEDGRVLSFR